MQRVRDGGAKALADGPRPPTMLVPAAATSFPSGHALEATAGLLAMLSFALPMMNVAGGASRSPR
ncbi:pAP2 superfamily protein [Mycobacterium intracellulare]|nr:pAP2 superfamily protein [Mycobacterium intracellulare]